LAVVAEQHRVLRPGGRLRPFEAALEDSGLSPLTALGLHVLQMNLGKMCNQTCKHCHVDAGPDRTEIMTRATMEACLRALAAADIPRVDLTGGAPEMNPHFRWLVERVRDLGRHVIDRCNLTILTVGGFRDLPEFLARHRVEVVASLPSFLARSTDAQRGAGVFDASIAAIRRLNDLGYGHEGTGLELNLVDNPVGAFLPPRQASAEADFRRELLKRHGLVFNHLFVITNMPINRFLEFLLRTEQYDAYMHRLIGAYNPSAAAGSCAARRCRSAGTASSTTATSTRCSSCPLPLRSRSTSPTSTPRAWPRARSPPACTATAAPPAPGRAAGARSSAEPKAGARRRSSGAGLPG
jgi:radical SAM/Cys-rich protein